MDIFILETLPGGKTVPRSYTGVRSQAEAETLFRGISPTNSFTVVDQEAYEAAVVAAEEEMTSDGEA